MKLKQFKAAMLKTNKQTNKPKPLSPFSIFRHSDTFKNLFLRPLQFSSVTYSGQTLVEKDFFWSQWSQVFSGCCGGHAVFQRGALGIQGRI